MAQLKSLRDRDDEAAKMSKSAIMNLMAKVFELSELKAKVQTERFSEKNDILRKYGQLKRKEILKIEKEMREELKDSEKKFDKELLGVQKEHYKFENTTKTLCGSMKDFYYFKKEYKEKLQKEEIQKEIQNKVKHKEIEDSKSKPSDSFNIIKENKEEEENGQIEMS